MGQKIGLGAFWAWVVTGGELIREGERAGVIIGWKLDNGGERESE